MGLGKVVLQPSGPTTQAEGGILYRACADCRNRVRLWKPPQTGVESTPARSADLQEPGILHETLISRAQAAAAAQEESAESVLAAGIERQRTILAGMKKSAERLIADPSIRSVSALEGASPVNQMRRREIDDILATIADADDILQDFAVKHETSIPRAQAAIIQRYFAR